MPQKKYSNGDTKGAINIPEPPWVPEEDKLQRDNILESMIDHISDYEKKFPNVDVAALKSAVLVPVLEAPDPSNSYEFDAADQIRGFLKAFKETATYKSQFKILDDRTQEQIDEFIKHPKKWTTSPIWKDTNQVGFILPEVNSNTCEVLTTSRSRPTLGFRVRQLLSRAFARVAQPLALFAFKLHMQRAARRLQKLQAKKYAGGPAVFEDEQQMQKMTVSVVWYQFAQDLLIEDRCTRICLSKIGVNPCPISPDIHLCPRQFLASKILCSTRNGTDLEFAAPDTDTVGPTPSRRTTKYSSRFYLSFRLREYRIQ